MIKYLVLAYVVIGVLIALSGVEAKLVGKVALRWWAIALAALAWPAFVLVALGVL